MKLVCDSTQKSLFLFFAFFSIISFSQETEYKQYSYSQFFEMIEAETDTVFELKNTIIKYNPSSDSLFKTPLKKYFSISYTREDTIVVDKALKLSNVYFDNGNFASDNDNQAIIHHIKFLREVEFFNTAFNKIVHSTFYKKVIIRDDASFYDELKSVQNKGYQSFLQWFRRCNFKEGLHYFSNAITDNPRPIFFEVYNSTIGTTNEKKNANHTLIRIGNQFGFSFVDNVFDGIGHVRFIANTAYQYIITGNKFLDQEVFIDIPSAEVSQLIINNNIIGRTTSMAWESYSSNYTIGWKQFNNNMVSWDNYSNYFYNEDQYNSKPELLQKDVRTSLKLFLDSIRIKNEIVYKGEIKFKGKFHRMYKEQYDNDLANIVYTEIKDLETERLAYLNEINPSFKTYFTWKVNQFLKLFSNYGTEPARAIIFSMYVILFFALIYLFFPNSWDSHGKNRLVDRYNFFFKYMKRKAGIHEVYLEGQREELMSYNQFRDNITRSEQKVPKFFIITALPLYRWAISGTKLSATILRRFDVMKGAWNDLPQNKRIWKSILLIGTFIIAVVYDLIIKILNALMLSINTFTTLGFGEIPIKGLPRYLAIIQGFIGWFMLTIFSVSLISQLLN